MTQDISPALAGLLESQRKTLASLHEQVEALESGAIRFLRGDADATPEAIDLAKCQIATLQAVLEHHDPDGLTRL
jgi:hypothetical protein